MSLDTQQTRWPRPGVLVAMTVALAISAGFLTGCDSLLDVDLPGTITDETFDDPGSAQAQVNSAIAMVECAYSAFVSGNAAGNAEVFLRIGDEMDGFAENELDPDDGACDTGGEDDYDWFDPFQTAISLSEDAYERIDEFGPEQVSNQQRLLAQSALYAAVPYEVFGEHMCELAVEQGPLLTPDEVLTRGEEWIDTALDHISNTGDFELPNDIAPSIETMAYALRARIRWARGNMGGAVSDAMQVPRGFVAYATRETGETRRNKIWVQHFDNVFGTVVGPVTWWDPADRTNPVTGQPWPDPIPFTGYVDLGILPDGRAVSDAGFPITTDAAGAVQDPRVPVEAIDLADVQMIPEIDQGYRQAKYTGEDQNIPLVNWKELWLIRAEAAGGQGAVDMVNEVRAADGLPMVTYIDGSAPDDQIEDMIIEERRRALFLEGRFWATKIKNADKLWFPRDIGDTPFGFDYQGGVRMIMDVAEYDLNENFGRNARGTGCSADERPTIVGL